MPEKAKETWLVVKLAAGDYCLQAEMDFEKPLPAMIKVKHLTKIMATDKGAAFVLWPPEKLGMTDGPILMRTDAISAFSTASGKMQDEMEEFWGMKQIVSQRKELVLP